MKSIGFHSLHEMYDLMLEILDHHIIQSDLDHSFLIPRIARSFISCPCMHLSYSLLFSPIIVALLLLFYSLPDTISVHCIHPFGNFWHFTGYKSTPAGLYYIR